VISRATRDTAAFVISGCVIVDVAVEVQQRVGALLETKARPA